VVTWFRLTLYGIQNAAEMHNHSSNSCCAAPTASLIGLQYGAAACDVALMNQQLIVLGFCSC
jgi:hypothetical protein